MLTIPPSKRALCRRLLYGAVLCGLGFSSMSGCIATGRASAPAPDSQAQPSTRYQLPSMLVAAAGASTDAATCLPTRVEHPASGIALRLILPGKFVMGPDPVGDVASASGFARRVDKPFYMAETETTVAQFAVFVAATGYRTDAERGVREGDHTFGAFSELRTGGGFNREWDAEANWRNPFTRFADELGWRRFVVDWPVVQVTWRDAHRFATHFGLTLPTEVQWEYAAHGGSTGMYPWGDAAADGVDHANVADASFARLVRDASGVFPFDDGNGLLARVGARRPNGFGLYDMIGNVEEWCLDQYRDLRRDDWTDETAPPAAGPLPHHMVIRGGSFLSGPGGCGARPRHAILAEGRREWIGFRVAANVQVVAR